MSDTLEKQKKMQISLAEELQLFGLTNIEARMYLYLLNKEPQTVLHIAQDLTLPRTSVYDSSLKLIEKGLVERIITYKGQKLKAFSLDILEHVINKEKERVENLEKQLKNLQTTIAHQFVPNTHTEVRYYHGIQGMMQMMWNNLNAKDETIGYSESGRIAIVGKKFKMQWNQEVINRGINDRVIINPNKETLTYHFQSGETHQRDQFQKTRVLSKEQLYISGDTTIYNNIFAVCYWKQGEVVGVEIENPEFVKNQKSIFEILWKLAVPIANYNKKLKL